MKYSIITPYYNRINLLKNTIDSFKSLYSNRSDWELIVPVDSKSSSQSEEVASILAAAKISYNTFIVNNDDGHCPPRLYNAGVRQCNGKFLIITNPEIKHETDILAGLDQEFDVDDKVYVICSCKTFPGDPFGNGTEWYQHTEFNNRLLHFCSAISKENYNLLGGFDEIYAKGISYDDDDFKQKIFSNKIKIILRDDLVSQHQEHSRQYITDNRLLIQLNKMIYCKKWKFHPTQVGH